MLDVRVWGQDKSLILSFWLCCCCWCCVVRVIENKTNRYGLSSTCSNTRGIESEKCVQFIYTFAYFLPWFRFFFSPSSHTFLIVAQPHHVCIYLECTEPRKRDVIFLIFLGGNFNYFSLFAAWSEFFNSFFCLSRGGIIMARQEEKSRRLSLTAGCAWHIQKSESSRTKVDCTTHQAPRYMLSRHVHGIHSISVDMEFSIKMQGFLCFLLLLFTLVCAHENLYIMVKKYRVTLHAAARQQQWELKVHENTFLVNM